MICDDCELIATTAKDGDSGDSSDDKTKPRLKLAVITEDATRRAVCDDAQV